MIYTINDKVLDKNNLTMDEFLLLLFYTRGAVYSEVVKELEQKGLSEQNLFQDNELILSDNTKELVLSLLIESDKKIIDKDEEFVQLANKLRELYPKGRKAASTYSWRDSTAVIARRLKILVSKYNSKFTEEQAIEVTKKYVESFNGNRKYMQLLKYFLLKTLPGGEIQSEFMAMLENDGEIEHSNNDWVSELK